MMNTLLLAVVGVILLRGILLHVDVYGAFLAGAEHGARSAAKLLPPLCAMLLMLHLLTSSGLTELVTRLLLPVTQWMGLPQELTPMVLLRPLTGSGSLAAMQEIFSVCGVDSRAGRLASALMGSSETIVYTLTVYVGAAGIRKVPGALTASLAGYLAGAAVCLLLVR
ncbi:MAG: spore maturation protein [Clostridia bacterium]|nr:spore maturation protein [Clostridia bacterium]